MNPVLKPLNGTIVAKRRPDRHIGKADVLWEETGECTTGVAEVEVQARRERFIEITSGRAISQQGLATTCKDLSYKEDEVGGRDLVWRMSS
jgi:hypothetical protein